MCSFSLLIFTPPHSVPYEDAGRFLERLARLSRPDGLTVQAIPGSDKPYPWIVWSDLVAGIGSLLLLEAVALGRPVISLQPGLTREDTFILGRRGLAPTLTDHAEGRRVVATLLQEPAARLAVLERERRFLPTIPRDTISPIMAWARRHASARPAGAGRQAARSER